MQRRLSDADSADLVRRYEDGESIDGLAREHGVNRTTVIHHLDRAGAVRRRVPRKMTDESVARAAVQYEQGASLEVVADEFGVHERTLAKGSAEPEPRFDPAQAGPADVHRLHRADRALAKGAPLPAPR